MPYLLTQEMLNERRKEYEGKVFPVTDDGDPRVNDEEGDYYDVVPLPGGKYKIIYKEWKDVEAINNSRIDRETRRD